jgi:hypothetical protein
MSASAGGFYPFNPTLSAQTMQGERGARIINRGFIAHLALTGAEAAAASAAGVHAAVTDTGVDQTITTAITNPPYTRNITATAGGTAGDIKAVSPIITGTNEKGAVITETLPAFTVNTAGIVTGAKCFKTVTSILLPAHDDTGATTAIGFGSKIGGVHLLSRNTIISAFLANVKEGTLPTVTVDDDELEKNGFTLNSSLAGTAVDIYYIIG